MPVESGIGLGTQYLLVNFTPKSDEQLAWEQGIRMVVEPLLLNGEHLRLPGGWEDSIERIESMETRAQQLIKTGPFLLRNIGFAFTAPSGKELALARRLSIARRQFQELPLHQIERFFGVGEHKVMVSSRYPEMESVIAGTVGSVADGFKDESDPDLFPKFGIASCELQFSSSVWIGRQRLIAPGSENFAKNGYVITDRGLELPTYVKQQIDAVVEVVTQPSS